MTSLLRPGVPAGTARSGRPGAHASAAAFRPDIEGLRAIAVVLVLLYHAGLPFLPGGFVGVDVFFVISGFLITGLIVRELTGTGSVSLPRFYARRIKRLLPATAAVLGSTALLSWLLLPPIRWAETARDIAASSLYVVNWRFAGQAVDYLAQGRAPSPVQHFWSLSVEEQYYLVWPGLLLLLTWWHRRTNRSDLERPLLLGLTAVFVPSLLWSMHETAADPGRAYFVTTTRMWELALGGAVAIVAPRLGRVSRPVAALLGWGGLALVVVAGVRVSAATPYPGTAALLPTLGAAAVVLGGGVTGRGPARLLGSAPLRAIGLRSYSLYLWHWPLLVVATAAWGPLSTGVGLLVVAASVVPACASFRFVEMPFRRAQGLVTRPRRGLVLGAACTTVGIVAGLLLLMAVPTVKPAAAKDAVGAGVLTGRVPSPGTTPGRGRATGPGPRRPTASPPPGVGAPVDRASSITPDPLVARADIPSLYKDGCHASASESRVLTCTYGDKSSAVDVVLVGDSHAAQWAPALQRIATQRHWRLRTMTKSDCPLIGVGMALRATRPYPSCTRWNAAAIARLTGPQRPDLVVTATSTPHLVERAGRILPPRQSRSAFAEGLRRTYGRLSAARVPVLVLQDTPRPPVDIPDCVSAHRQHLKACAFARSGALVWADTFRTATRGLLGVRLVDMNPDICPTPRCAAVIGDVLVYRDNSHLTVHYVLSLAAALGAAMPATLPQPWPPRLR